jgi:hypothetical protein
VLRVTRLLLDERRILVTMPRHDDIQVRRIAHNVWVVPLRSGEYRHVKGEPWFSPDWIVVPVTAPSRRTSRIYQQWSQLRLGMTVSDVCELLPGWGMDFLRQATKMAYVQVLPQSELI